MIRQLLLAGACLAVAMAWTATAQAQDRRSPRNIEDAANRVAALADKAKDIAERYQRWEREGKLLQQDENSEPRRLDKLLKEMQDALQPIRSAYDLAVGTDGWTASDAQVQKVVEGFQKVEDQFIKMGYWYPRKLTDKPLKEEFDLAYARTLACRGMMEAKAGGDLDGAKGLLAQADRKLADLVKQSEKDADQGNKFGATPDLAKHPYFLATRKEIDRLKADSEAGMKTMSGGRDKAKEDWKALTDLWKANEAEVRKLDMSHIQQDEWAPLLDRVEAFEARLPALKKSLDAFCKTYGQTASEITDKMRTLLGDEFERMPTQPGLHEAANGLLEVVKQLPATRKDMAAHIYQSSMQDIDLIKSYDEARRVDALGKIAGHLQLAAKYDPENADVQGQLKKMGDVVAKAATEIQKSIDSRSWPGHIADFQGPGTTEALAQSILEYAARTKIIGNPAKDASKPLAVCITSNWFSGSKNIIGETTSWCLKASIAFERDKDKDVADVFDVTVSTKEERGVAKAPPWAGMSIPNSWQMRMSKVAGRAAVASAADSTSGDASRSGGLGLFGWLLAMANILAGLLAVAPLVTRKLPQAKGFYDKITPFRNLIGVVVLCIGVVSLLWCLVTLHPLANLLPQLAAIVAGLFLGKELILRKPALVAATPPAGPVDSPAQAPASPGGPEQAKGFAIGSAKEAGHKAGEAVETVARKAQDILIRHRQLLDQLDKYQTPIGIACLVLGILHLIIGGRILF